MRGTFEFMQVHDESHELIAQIRKRVYNIWGFVSDYSLQDKMANKTSTVNEFLESLHTKISPLYERDISFLTELAKKDGVDKVDYWDTSYYKRIFKQLNTSLNHEEVKLNFPVERTIRNIFMIFEKLLNYSFVKTNKYDSTLWHEEVELYEVFEEGIKKGYFYLDLFPREGKHTGAAVFPMISKSEVNLPVDEIEASTVPALSCHCCKSAVCPDNPTTVNPTLDELVG
jgi:Zn-dependent oligopeptidase